MRRIAAAAVVASIAAAGCGSSASADPFCDAAKEFTVEAASMFSLIGSDDPAADLREKRAEAHRRLDRLDETAPEEIDTDVRRLTGGWRAALDGKLGVVPPETGQRVTEWTSEHCGEPRGVRGESPYPAPTAPPPPPAPPAP
jgi:hypothetical protein